MSSVALAAAVVAIAAWMVVPFPAGRLVSLQGGRRAEPLLDLPGRAGAPPAGQRVAFGATAGLLAALVVEGWSGLVLGGGVALVATLGLGFAAPRPDWSMLTRELPDALDFLAVCMDAGLPTAHAVGEVARVSPSATRRLLQEVAAQLALGRAGPAAWESLRSHPVWGRVAVDVIRAEHAGTALAGVLRDHAEDARQEHRDAAARRARTVGVRSVVPLMACFLPAFMAVGVVPIIASLMQSFFG
ncbi:MAG TPA: type II secretion system F family protein [Arachnia sp.]|nr:type II secretion system F family protein [Arachnia sp.]